MARVALFIAGTTGVAAQPALTPGFQLLLAMLSCGALFTSIATVVVGTVQERGRRKDAAEQRVLQSTKELAEGETVREASYRDLAEQARKNAETAVAVIERSLGATQALADRLQHIVDSQNQTIQTLTAAAASQSDIVLALTRDRDAALQALEVARQKVADLEVELRDTRAKYDSASRELALLDDLLAATRKPVLDTTGPIPTAR